MYCPAICNNEIQECITVRSTLLELQPTWIKHKPELWEMAVVPNNFLLSSKALLCQYANTKMDQLTITEDNSTIEQVIPLNDELNGVPLSRVSLILNRRDVDIPENAPLPDEIDESLEYDFPRQNILVLVDDWGAGNGTIELCCRLS